jgi:alpha-L-fucosidase
VIDEPWQKASAKYDSARNSILPQVDKVNRDGPYRADWQSLQTYQVRDWYRDAKFGIFIHWGVYSVPPFAVRGIRARCTFRARRNTSAISPLMAGRINTARRILFPCSRRRNSIRRQGLACSKESGAKYVVPVFEHHDGFAMYDSGLPDWTAAKLGPHRDLMGDLGSGSRRGGCILGLRPNAAM